MTADLGLAQCAADLALEIGAVDLSAVAVLNELGQVITVVSAGSCRRLIPGPVNDPPDWLVHRVLTSRAPVSTSPDETRAEFARSARGRGFPSGPPGPLGLAAVPVVVDGEVRGILYGGTRSGDRLGERELGALERVAALLAAGLSVVRPVSIDATAATAAPLPPEADPRSDEPDGVAGSCLTTRELTMLRLLGRGFSTKEIAVTECLALSSVRTYIQSALRKLGCTHRLQAVALGRRYGLI